jgi:hypothetical protein
MPGSYGTCPSLLLFGVYCPGCGSLRATADLVHGDLPEALGHNLLILPAIVVILGWAGFVLVAGGVPRRVAQRVPRRMHSVNAPAAAGVVLVGFALLRNIPGSPLAP